MTSTSRRPRRVTAAPPDAFARMVRQASAALRAGEVIAIPTDTVYGLAAAIDRPEAIARLYALKGRPLEKAIPILLSDFALVQQVATGVSATATRLASVFWPGALTLVLAARPQLPPRLTSTMESGLRTVAVRVPDDALTRAIIAACGGALAVTSANRSGENPALVARDAATLDEAEPMLVIDGGEIAGGVPSTIVLAITGAPVILREGAISAAEIAAALGDGHLLADRVASAQYDQHMSGQVRHSSMAEPNP